MVCRTLTPRDQLGRPLGVLRLSLTARCNFACPYCLPDSQEPPGLLTLEQRVAVVEAAVALGVRSLRLTGGEPLLHPQVEELIGALQPLRAAGLEDIALTTNGTLLTAERATALRLAGLDRITISLDGTTAASVKTMAGLPHGLAAETALRAVIQALGHGVAAGFDPGAGDLKLNAVILRGRNDDQILPLARLARERGLELRLIEAMDVGTRNGWCLEDVVPASAMVARIGEQWPLEPLGRQVGATAIRWRYVDGCGTIAVVASISAPFCGDCNRLRVTAEGMAYTCLFASEGVDLRPWLQPGGDSRALGKALRAMWLSRSDRYSEERQSPRGSSSPVAAKEMAYLGG